jgi:hypothetical protein
METFLQIECKEILHDCKFVHDAIISGPGYFWRAMTPHCHIVASEHMDYATQTVHQPTIDKGGRAVNIQLD